MNPLDEKPKLILKKILNQKMIKDPKNVFKTFTTQKSRGLMAQHISQIEKAIRKACLRNEFEQARNMLTDLRYLLHIQENPSDQSHSTSDFQSIFENIREELKHISERIRKENLQTLDYFIHRDGRESENLRSYFSLYHHSLIMDSLIEETGGKECEELI